jgi:hypothetical protein
MLSQPKIMSFFEAIVNILVGISISMTANMIILPIFFGKTVPFMSYVYMTSIFTGISIVRSYLLRRFFNYLHVRKVYAKC